MLRSCHLRLLVPAVCAVCFISGLVTFRGNSGSKIDALRADELKLTAAILQEKDKDSKQPKEKPEAENSDDVREFMRDKLDSSQSVLEGLVTEDYKKIQTGAERMKLMSFKADWNVYQGLEYAEQSKAFRRATELLAKMAKEKNLDGASLAYLQVTMSCVNCHKWTKGPDVVQLLPKRTLSAQHLARKLKAD